MSSRSPLDPTTQHHTALCGVNATEPLQIAEWIVVSRPGTPSPQPTARIHLLDTLALEISATRIRAQSHIIQTATQIGDLTPEVAAYIDQLHLYRE